MSNPDISFTVLKEDTNNYYAIVTCQSTKGTLPVTFSLHKQETLETLGANQTVNERKATFKVPLVLGEHMGHLRCQANNGNQTAYSKRIPLEVGMLFDKA